MIYAFALFFFLLSLIDVSRSGRCRPTQASKCVHLLSRHYACRLYDFLSCPSTRTNANANTYLSALSQRVIHWQRRQPQAKHKIINVNLRYVLSINVASFSRRDNNQQNVLTENWYLDTQNENNFFLFGLGSVNERSFPWKPTDTDTYPVPIEQKIRQHMATMHLVRAQFDTRIAVSRTLHIPQNLYALNMNIAYYPVMETGC